MNGFSFVNLALTEHLEEQARESFWCRVYSFLTLVKVMVLVSVLTLIPLFNRLKERYACGPT